MQIADVNELGQMVGTGRRRTGTDPHAVRLDPVEPAAAVVPLGTGCGTATPAPMRLRASTPIITRSVVVDVDGALAAAPGALAVGAQAATPLPLFGGCALHVDVSRPVAFLPFVADASGQARLVIPAAPAPGLLGARLALQAAGPGAGQPFDLSDAVAVELGF